MVIRGVILNDKNFQAIVIVLSEFFVSDFDCIRITVAFRDHAVEMNIDRINEAKNSNPFSSRIGRNNPCSTCPFFLPAFPGNRVMNFVGRIGKDKMKKTRLGQNRKSLYPPDSPMLSQDIRMGAGNQAGFFIRKLKFFFRIF